MAVSHTLIAQAEDNGSPDFLDLPSTVDLVQGRLYTLWIETGSTVTVASVTSPNETWVEVLSITVAGNGRLTLYRSEASGNRTDEQITITSSSSWTSASALLIETQGQVQGNNGADAILQTDSDTSTGTSATATLTNAPESGSGVLAGFLYNANEAADAAGDSTELGNEFHNLPVKGIIVVSDDDQSADASWSSNVAFGWIIIEIDEAAAGGTNHTRNVDDSLSISDAIKFARTLAVADSLSISDAIRFARGLAVADSLSIADAIKFGRGIGISDSLSIADSITPTRGIVVTINDSASVADSLASEAELFRTVDDTAALADVLTRAAEYFRTVNDTVGLADAIQAGLAFARTVDDLVSLADNVLRAVGYHRSVADTLSLADSIDVDHTAAPTDHTRQINDSVVITDVISLAGVESDLEKAMDLMWRFTRRRDARRTFGR